MKAVIHGLYAVTPEGVEDSDLLARVARALEGGARVVQYRNKIGGHKVRTRQARILQSLCLSHGVPLIVNDHVEIAATVGAAGVHLGEADGSVAAARARLGSQAIVGASCYNDIERAHRAVASGADYIAFGSFFASANKPHAVRASADMLREARRVLAVPIVAIGGITANNAPALIAAGADAIAVISDLFDAPDVRQAAERLSRLFAAAESP
jgi:thiamine-phosphate pyrophosphorylase